ncbi:ribonuclease D [Alphaproteobacteria bacterium]|nr:ribonuclease D [Alphaproteobacteria bacterium]
MAIINDQDQLEKLCIRLADSPFITVDTEFIREKTYWPQLCLIQVGTEQEAACIDPLAELDLAPFYRLLADPKVVKIMHSGRQDVEIFYHLAGIIPAPLFDTQVAAMVCGYGEQVSYQQLVNDICRIALDKGQRFTNWAARPLSDSQEKYALADVVHLVPVYLHLKQRLEDSGRAHWVDEEMAKLYSPSVYEGDAGAWRRILPAKIGRKSAAILRALYLWREEMAQALDRPRKFIATDEHLLAVSGAAPSTMDDLNNLRVSVAAKHKDAILAVIAEVLAQPPESYPAPDKPVSAAAAKRSRPLLALLRVLLSIKEQESGVAGRLIASAEQLEDMARGAGQPENSPVMQGWRYELFGHDAQRLMQGLLALSFNPKKRALELLESPRAVAQPDPRTQPKLPI